MADRDTTHDTAALGLIRRYLTGDQAAGILRSRAGLAPDPTTNPSPVPQPGPATAAAQGRVSAFSRPMPVIVVGPKPLEVKIKDGGVGGPGGDKDKEPESTRELLKRLFGTVLSPLQKLAAASDRQASGQDLYERSKGLLFTAIAPIVLPLFIMFAAGLMTVSQKLFPTMMKIATITGPTLIKALEGMIGAVVKVVGALDEFSKWVNRITGVTKQQEQAKEAGRRADEAFRADEARRARTDELGVRTRAEDADTHEEYARRLRAKAAAEAELLEPGSPERKAADRRNAEQERKDEEKYRKQRAVVFAPPRQGETVKEIDPRLRVLEAKIAEPMRAAGIEPDFPNIEKQHKDIAERARNENNPVLRALDARLDKLVPVYQDFFKAFGQAPDEVQKARHAILAEGKLPEPKEGQAFGAKPPAEMPGQPGPPPRPRAGEGGGGAMPGGQMTDLRKNMDAIAKAFEMQAAPRVAVQQLTGVHSAAILATGVDPIEAEKIRMMKEIAVLLQELIATATKPDNDGLFGGNH